MISRGLGQALPARRSRSLAVAAPEACAAPVASAALPADRGPLATSWRYAWGKRALDIALAIVVLTLLCPFLLLVAALIRASGRGPILFRQTRVGRGGATFRMLKFRTMRHGCEDGAHRDYVRLLLADQAEAHDGLYKLVDDPRVTRVGAVLRRFSIDEVPQLVNVLRGDMTLVGPRPALPYEAELFPVWSAPRYLVAPGVTGLWQVCGRNRLTMLQGLKLDVEYVEHRSFGLDVRILVRTVPAVLGRGAR
jgi:lipopolysaccharide/colanic/teichoic acid biosynthesis glycosyltransferase